MKNENSAKENIEQLEQERVKTIWHYTNFKAFCNIMQEGHLWLCNTKGMNDKNEMLAFIYQVEKLIKAQHPRFTKQIHEFFKREIARHQHKSIYGSSFSYLMNDAAQWERYGYMGKGVSIGFNMNLLLEICSPFMIENVSYSRDYRNRDFVKLLPEEIFTGEPTQMTKENIDRIFGLLWATSGAYKDYSFKSEMEVRLMTTPVSAANTKPYGEIHYDAAFDKVREYIIFDVKRICQANKIDVEDLITDVIIGPKSTQNIVILQNFLAKLGLWRLAKNVCVSDCPLR